MRIGDLLSKKQLKVEIVDTPSSLERGLMFRKSLDDDAGMLFKFTRPQNLKFWGLNTYIPLDIAFVNKDNEITKITRIDPMSTKMVESGDHCDRALEANIDFFQKNKISVGDKIAIVDNDYESIVIF